MFSGARVCLLCLCPAGCLCECGCSCGRLVSLRRPSLHVGRPSLHADRQRPLRPRAHRPPAAAATRWEHSHAHARTDSTPTSHRRHACSDEAIADAGAIRRRHLLHRAHPQHLDCRLPGSDEATGCGTTVGSADTDTHTDMKQEDANEAHRCMIWCDAMHVCLCVHLSLSVDCSASECPDTQCAHSRWDALLSLGPRLTLIPSLVSPRTSAVFLFDSSFSPCSGL